MITAGLLKLGIKYDSADKEDEVKDLDLLYPKFQTAVYRPASLNVPVGPAQVQKWFQIGGKEPADSIPFCIKWSCDTTETAALGQLVVSYRVSFIGPRLATAS